MWHNKSLDKTYFYDKKFTMSHDQINNNELLEERRILKTEIRDMKIELQYKRKKLWDIEKRLRNDEENSENDKEIRNSTTDEEETVIEEGINEQCEENINKNQETRKEKTRKRSE